MTFSDIFKSSFLENITGVSLLDMGITLLLSFAIAVMIMPFKKKTQSVFKAMYYLPGIASGVALSVVWLWLYDSSPDGIFNRILVSSAFRLRTGCPLPRPRCSP